MSLTGELRKPDSPIRRFFEERLGSIGGIQRNFRENAGQLRVPSGEANAGTVGTATDWLLRFLVRPDPPVDLAMRGTIPLGPTFRAAFLEVAATVGATVPSVPDSLPRPLASDKVATAEWVAARRARRASLKGTNEQKSWQGPTLGSTIEAELLARFCWLLALCTEVYRGGGRTLVTGPLARYRDTGSRPVLAEELLALAPHTALEEVALLREVLERVLLPVLRTRNGPWRLGPVFAGSDLVGNADGDLCAAGLLLELKTTKGRRAKARDSEDWMCTLRKDELQQLVGYALLDFDDEYQLDELAIFSVRYEYLVRWQIGYLVAEISDGQLDVVTARQELRERLTADRTRRKSEARRVSGRKAVGRVPQRHEIGQLEQNHRPDFT
jgi:hypothetical protein